MSKLASRETSKVRVICRVRPPNQIEASRNGSNCVKLGDQSIDITVDDSVYSFSFDKVFGPDSTQPAVFDYSAVPLISDVLAGYNATVFAYG